MNDYLSMQFGVYLLRWIFSTFVMMIPLWFLIKIKCCYGNKYQEYIHLVLVQIFGAFIFWWIDKAIFS